MSAFLAPGVLLCLRDVLKPPGILLGLGKKSSTCSLRMHKELLCIWCNYQLTNLGVCLGTMWFIVKFHYNFTKS